MKTALKQLIEYLDPIHSGIKQKAEELLEVEKEQIIESYCQGCADIIKDDSIFPREISEQYYNETFTK